MSHIATYPSKTARQVNGPVSVDAEKASVAEHGFEGAIGVAIAWIAMYATIILAGLLRAVT
jgi:hypothetical protein